MFGRRNLQNTAALMKLLNLVIILFYCLITYVTTYRICRTFGAYGFLSDVGFIPQKPWHMPVFTLSAYALLYAAMNKKNEYADTGKIRLVWSLAEIMLCAVIIQKLNFYYSGIILMVLADLVTYVRTNSSKMVLIGFLMIMYALLRYDVMTYTLHLIPFSSYLNYYSPYIQSYLAGLASIAGSVNVLLFVYYMVILFTSQKDETERIRNLYTQLIDANNKLKEYSIKLERMTEIRERNRLAREIHDTLGHTLTGIIMSSEASAALFETDPEASRQRMLAVAQSARNGLNDVRHSIKALRPDALAKHNLEQAIETMIDDFRRNTSVTIRYRQNAGKLDLAEDEEDTLYRIIQECMTNAVRHGQADEIDIELTRQDCNMQIDIRDNGIGSDDLKEGFGLRHMQERLELLSGSLTYGNRADDPEDGNRGFYLIATLPLRKKEGEQTDDQSTHS